MSCIQTDIRGGCTLWKKSHSWWHPTNIEIMRWRRRPSVLLHAFTFGGKNGIDVKFLFLPPSFVACFISISFIFHFAIFMGMWMVSDTYYNRSACVILDAVVFTFLYLSHSTCHTFMKYSFRCLLKQDWKGQPWKPCHSDRLYKYTPKPVNQFFTHLQSRNVYWLSEFSSKQRKVAKPRNDVGVKGTEWNQGWIFFPNQFNGSQLSISHFMLVCRARFTCHRLRMLLVAAITNIHS